MRQYLFLSFVLFPLALPGATTPSLVPGSAATVTLKPCTGENRTGSLSLILTGADQAREISLRFSPPDSWGDPKVDLPDNTLPVNQTKVFKIGFTLTGCAVPPAGILLIDTKTASQVTDTLVLNLTFKVLPDPNKRPSWPDAAMVVFLAPLLLALLVAVGSGIAVRGDLNRRMGSPKWDFSNSWATNITIGGGILVSVLQFATFPDNGRFLDKSSYLAASIALSVLAVIAPQAYNIFRKPAAAADPANPAGIQFQGFVVAFVIAAAVTSWAAIGQAAVTALALGEIYCSGYLSPYLAIPLIVLLILLCLGLVVYAVGTVIFTVGAQTAHPGSLAAMARDGTPAPASAAIPPWFIL
jgi:hypothetical protein